MQNLREKADTLVLELVSVLKEMEAADPVIRDEDGFACWENGNGRQVVEYAETICRNVLEAVRVDSMGGCLLCRS